MSNWGLELGDQSEHKTLTKKSPNQNEKVSHTIFEALSTFLFKIFEYVFILKTVKTALK